MESKSKKRYLVNYDNQNFTIYADYVIGNYKLNRMQFFHGKPESELLQNNSLVASFPLDKSAITQITNY